MFPAIVILGSDSDAELKRAFQDLAAALQLRVEFSASTDLPNLAAIICVGDLPENLPAVPKFQFISGNPPSANRVTRTLEFAGSSILPGFLHERNYRWARNPAGGSRRKTTGRRCRHHQWSTSLENRGGLWEQGLVGFNSPAPPPL